MYWGNSIISKREVSQCREKYIFCLLYTSRTDEFFQEEIVPLEGKAENILIVAHGCVVRSFILNFTKRPLSEFWKTPFGRNCSSAAFEYKNGEINMIYENKLYYDVDCPDWQQQVPVYKKGRAR